MAAFTVTEGAVTVSWSAAVICTSPVGALMVTPLESIRTDVSSELLNSIEPSSSESVPVSPPGVENVIVALLAGCSTIAIRVPALPVMVQRSTLLPDPPIVSGAVSAAIPKAAQYNGDARIAAQERHHHFVAYIRNEKSAAIASRERHSYARPYRSILVGNAVRIVEPHLYPIAVLRVLNIRHRGEKQRRPQQLESGFVQQQAHEPAPR